MKAVVRGEDGKCLYTEVGEPTLHAGEALIEIHAAALNRADLLQRAGNYPPPPGWPAWYGLECAGIIRALSPETEQAGKWHVGDEVCALLGGGGYAEYVAVPDGMLMPIPKGLSMVEAAALPEIFGASWLFLKVEGAVKAGDTVLVTGGTSGLASVTIPMAKAFGARVLTTVRSEKGEAAAKLLNPDKIINTSKIPLAEAMRGENVDIVIDCLGGEDVGACLPQMNRGGRWIMIATLAGDITPVDLRMMYVKGLRLIGTTLRSRTAEYKAEMLKNMTETLWPKVEAGDLRPVIARVYPIDEAEQAQQALMNDHCAGKIVLKVREEN